MKAIFQTRISEAIQVLNSVNEQCFNEFDAVASAIFSTFSKGKKLLICGNGGSAADSQHLAAEFVSSFSAGLSRKALPAIALTVDSSILTAVSNDFNFDLVFERQVEALGCDGDALLVISTSGESENCIRALKKAKKAGLRTLALTRNNSSLYEMAEVSIGIPSQNTQHIQEAHVVLYHCLAEAVEERILGR